MRKERFRLAAQPGQLGEQIENAIRAIAEPLTQAGPSADRADDANRLAAGAVCLPDNAVSLAEGAVGLANDADRVAEGTVIDTVDAEQAAAQAVNLAHVAVGRATIVGWHKIEG